MEKNLKTALISTGAVLGCIMLYFTVLLYPSISSHRTQLLSELPPPGGAATIKYSSLPDLTGEDGPRQPLLSYGSAVKHPGVAALPPKPRKKPAIQQRQKRRMVMRTIRRWTASTNCLPSSLKRKVNQLESRFGRIRIISTFRRGARIAGTGRVSKHASCRAIDFKPARGQYRQVVRWLRATHRGGLGTYSCAMHHIHIDNGPKLRWHHCVNSAGRPKHRRRASLLK